MASTQDINKPFVFKIGLDSILSAVASNDVDSCCIAVKSRSLGGMLKEALVHNGPLEATWRMVSDEGPYLNGTDLAPFPLAFFSAGIAIDIASNIRLIAERDGVSLSGLELSVNNYFTMEGSALKGTMKGQALPVSLHVKAEGVAKKTLHSIVDEAVRYSATVAYVKVILQNEFSLHHNGDETPIEFIKSTAEIVPPPHIGDFNYISPEGEALLKKPILSKLKEAEKKLGVTGGVGSSLQAIQKRTLHVSGNLCINENGFYEADIELFQPIGSSFRFIGDDLLCRGGRARAPTGLDYFSAGIAFCLMTQFERYSKIVKFDLASTKLFQKTKFMEPAIALKTGAATASPVVTHVYVDTSENLASTQKLLQMGERTCFLHATARSDVPVRVEVEAR